VQVSPAYEVTSLVRRHGDVLANDSITLEVQAGEVFGLLGPNGAGKTTLVRQLVGLLAPDAGSVRLLGEDLVAHPGRAAQLVGYLPQDDAALADLSVGLAIETTARLRGLRRPAAARARAGVVDELGLGPLCGRTIGALSGGERRLAAVACALVGDRPVLVLDEPTTGLDPTARRAVWAALDRRRHEHGATVVLVTHNVLEAESVLDRVAVLEAGRVIACDTPGRLKASVGSVVRLDLVWRQDPPLDEPAVAAIAAVSRCNGRRWSARMPPAEAREALARVTSGRALDALDDFTLATASLEDVYLSLGGRPQQLERT